MKVLLNVNFSEASKMEPFVVFCAKQKINSRCQGISYSYNYCFWAKVIRSKNINYIF